MEALFETADSPIGVATQENWCFAILSGENLRPHRAHGTRPSASIGAICMGWAAFADPSELDFTPFPEFTPFPPPPFAIPQTSR